VRGGYNQTVPKPPNPHIAYWRQPAEAARNVPVHPPLAPLSNWEIGGLIAVALLIGALVLLSVGWWVQAVHR
jgi:hypothetical protein